MKKLIVLLFCLSSQLYTMDKVPSAKLLAAKTVAEGLMDRVIEERNLDSLLEINNLPRDLQQIVTESAIQNNKINEVIAFLVSQVINGDLSFVAKLNQLPVHLKGFLLQHLIEQDLICQGLQDFIARKSPNANFPSLLQELPFELQFPVIALLDADNNPEVALLNIALRKYVLTPPFDNPELLARLFGSCGVRLELINEIINDLYKLGYNQDPQAALTKELTSIYSTILHKEPQGLSAGDNKYEVAKKIAMYRLISQSVLGQRIVQEQKDFFNGFLTTAILFAKIPFLELLLQEDININELYHVRLADGTQYSTYPLIYAVMQAAVYPRDDSYPDIIRMLVNAGAHVNAVNPDGLTVFKAAGDNQKLRNLLFDLGVRR